MGQHLADVTDGRLAGVYGNVLRCGAVIECDSEPGRGTEFRIYFRKV